MEKKNKLIYLFFIIILLASCTKEIEFDQTNNIEYISEESAKKALLVDLRFIHLVFKKNDIVKKGKEYRRVKRILDKLCEYNHISPKPKFIIFKTNYIKVPQAIRYTVVMSVGTINAIESDDELAFVLGHEISHILNGDTKTVDTKFLKAMKYIFYNVNIDIEPSSSFVLSLDSSDWLTANLTSLILAPISGIAATKAAQEIESYLYIFNREMEYHADINSVKLMEKAHYDPRASITFWGHANKIFKERKESLNKTHPSYGDRRVLLLKFIHRSTR